MISFSSQKQKQVIRFTLESSKVAAYQLYYYSSIRASFFLLDLLPVTTKAVVDIKENTKDRERERERES